MEVIGTILVLLSLGVFCWAVVGLIRPELARLPNRASAAKLWAVSVAILVLGAVITPPPTEAKLAERRAAAEAREDARAERAAAEAAREAEEAAAVERERAEAAEHERAAERAATEAALEAEDRLVGVSNRVYPGVESVRRIATDLIADMDLQPGPLNAIPAGATFDNFHWGGQPSVGGLRAVLNGSEPSLSHLEWHEADGVMRLRTAEKVCQTARAAAARTDDRAKAGGLGPDERGLGPRGRRNVGDKQEVCAACRSKLRRGGGLREVPRGLPRQSVPRRGRRRPE